VLPLGLLPKGTRFDLFRGTTPADVLEEEKCPSKPHKLIKVCSYELSTLIYQLTHLNVSSSLEPGPTRSASPSAGTGSIWSPDHQMASSKFGISTPASCGKTSSIKLMYELVFLSNLSRMVVLSTGGLLQDDIMMHDDPVLCAAFSRDSELLATGGANGEIKVWRVATGSCVRKFPTAHTGAITCKACLILGVCVHEFCHPNVFLFRSLVFRAGWHAIAQHVS